MTSPLILITEKEQPAGNARVCQWCNGAVKPSDTLRVGIGRSGTLYLVYSTCASDTLSSYKEEE